MHVVGQNVPHDSARLHVTGKSLFIDDIPPRRDELFIEVFGSPIAHGRLRHMDLSSAAATSGVVCIVTAKDIPGHRHFGPIEHDDWLLADDVVQYVGDPLALIAAESRTAARNARRKVDVEIDSLSPILTIDQAVDAQQFFGAPRLITTGDVDAELAKSEHVIGGHLRIGGQEHFYLESQAAIAYPGEQRTITVVSSTQHPSEVQAVVAEVLGLPFNHVIVQCVRMGGAFGGKETQAAQPAAMAALVAFLTGRPARIVLERDDDMAGTGKRHEFFAKYRAGFDSHGRIQALVLDLVANGGCSTDLSPAVLERAMLHADNAYYLPTARITGRICKTNLPSNTAFRGFGGPQAVACIENILEDIATTLDMDPFDLRQINAYGIEHRNKTHYGQIVRNHCLPHIFEQLRRTSEYDSRRDSIRRWNRQSKLQLRGLAVTAVKFGISFTRRTLNQANALVNVYADGTVLVSTGATEMGQGVHTRVRQLVADDLGVPYEDVLVATTSTEKNNNTSPTAASCGTDLNGAAALDATSRIRSRLAGLAAQILSDPQRGIPASPEHVHFLKGLVCDDRLPERKLTFRELVQRAYLERISLGERGFYATPGIDFNRETGQGNPFRYYTCGAAVAEVLIDRFTGETSVPRVDVLIDIGIPINPGIDHGQVVGGFIQGMGWVTSEELKYDADGVLLSHSPTTYKIPNVRDLPLDFRVNLFDNPHCHTGVQQSKAVGEPPLLLGLSVWVAIKNAIGHRSHNERFPWSLPATPEVILMATNNGEGGRLPQIYHQIHAVEG